MRFTRDLLRLACATFIALNIAHAGPPAAVEIPAEPLSKGIRDLKMAVLQLNRDLSQLEEELLIPATTRFKLYISIDEANPVELDSVQLRIDDKLLASHIYSEREVDALKRGGVQPLYSGNLAPGEHRLSAHFRGRGGNHQDYQGSTTLDFKKQKGPMSIELQVVDNGDINQPQLTVRVWE